MAYDGLVTSTLEEQDMEGGQSSRTAEYMALFRALESAKPPGRRLFFDPLAQAFLDRQLGLVALAGRFGPMRASICWLIDTVWPGARASGVARTRLIDDLLAERQGELDSLVILGAGYDSRAYRLPWPLSAQLLELDAPDTQALKRRRLCQLLGREPAQVRFVAVDFNRQRLEDALADIRLAPAGRTLFLWEGVTNYLSAEAVAATLDSLRQLAERPQLIFTYIEQSALELQDASAHSSMVRRRLRSVGEQWTFGIDPGQLPDYLAQRGFHLLEDVDSLAYRRRYLGGARRQLRGYEFYHVAVAQADDR
jgi:methyltransferase (TIGR00027 family)